jgi:pimeloyl-ACP methyl ester carboxylesterase
VSWTERFVAAGDAEVFLREWGDDGPPILFWHALGDHTGLQMIEAAPILAGDYGYRVVALDAPGFGGSPRVTDDRYEIPALLALAEKLLDALGVDRVVWSGSSWGASLGVHFACSLPARAAALVLVDGGYQGVGADDRSLDELRQELRALEGWRFESWEAMLAASREDFGRWSPELEEYVRSAYRADDGGVASIMGPDVNAAALKALRARPPTSELAALGETGIPVLLLAATAPPEDETWRGPRLDTFRDLVPQADVRRTEGTPHLMLEANPEETAAAIGDWLKGLPYA